MITMSLETGVHKISDEHYCCSVLHHSPFSTTDVIALLCYLYENKNLTAASEAGIGDRFGATRGYSLPFPGSPALSALGTVCVSSLPSPPLSAYKPRLRLRSLGSPVHNLLCLCRTSFPVSLSSVSFTGIRDF